MGAGAGKSLSAVRWGVAGNIVAAWLVTVPVTALLGAVSYWLAGIFGNGALGPILIVLALASAVTYGLRTRRIVLPAAAGVDPPEAKLSRAGSG
jgi:PiT family inorganic phosphate transporter